jgi:putative ATP-binding cassette transporter
MVVPAKPYIPISTLRAAVTYPAVPGTYLDADIRRALVDARLGDLVNELDREEVWSQRLSSGEQRRIGATATEDDDHVHRPPLRRG